MSSSPLQSAASSISESAGCPGFGSKLAIGMLPFTPVQFSGPDALIAWGRLIGYSAIAYYTFGRMKKLSYIAMSCAGVSLATSLSASLWKKQVTE